MILKWGGYTHDQNEVGLKIQTRSLLDQFDRVMSDVYEYHILGAKLADSQALLTTALAALEAAYLGSTKDNKDLKLQLDDGVTDTQHTLLNADCFGGTKVVHFGYPEGPWKMQLEYANRRTFYAVIRGEKRYTDTLYSWQERVTTRGTAGTKWRFMPSLTGDPEKQDLQLKTPVMYVQQGQAIGRTAIPSPSSLMLASSSEHGEMRETTDHTPQQIRIGGQELYLTQWKYVFETYPAATLPGFTLPTIT